MSNFELRRVSDNALLNPVDLAITPEEYCTLAAFLVRRGCTITLWLNGANCDCAVYGRCCSLDSWGPQRKAIALANLSAYGVCARVLNERIGDLISSPWPPARHLIAGVRDALQSFASGLTATGILDVLTRLDSDLAVAAASAPSVSPQLIAELECVPETQRTTLPPRVVEVDFVRRGGGGFVESYKCSVDESGDVRVWSESEQIWLSATPFSASELEEIRATAAQLESDAHCPDEPPLKVCESEHAALSLRSLTADLTFTVPPQYQGQTVEVAYACDGEWAYERRTDRSDGTVTVAAFDITRVEDVWEPWNCPPVLGECMVEPVTMIEGRK